LANDDLGRPEGKTLILRLWRDDCGPDAPWRCSVEDPLSRQRRGFSTLAELVPFLHLLTTTPIQPPEADPRTAGRDPLKHRNETT